MEKILIINEVVQWVLIIACIYNIKRLANAVYDALNELKNYTDNQLNQK